MDSEGPKRRFWQIHLSTAAILMIVAGVMIGFFNELWKQKNNRNELPDSCEAVIKAVLIVIALGMLALIGYISESFIRGREAQRHE